MMKRNRFTHILAACLATLALAAGSTTVAAQEATTVSSSKTEVAVSSSSSRLSLRANLLTWALGSPGLGLSLDLSPRWQLSLDGSYGNWDISHHRSTAVRLSTLGLETRRYFRAQAPHRAANCPLSIVNCQLPRGCYLGLDVRYTHFNHLHNDLGREGDLITAGILVGYTFRLGHSRWSLDTSLGCGYIHRSYDRYTWYEPAGQFRNLGHRNRNGLGLTNINAGISYRL